MIRSYILTMTLVALAACTTVGTKQKGGMAQVKMTQIEVHGHRGARGVYPENSLPAFEYALQSGADVLELDLGVTRDEVLVVAHDPYLSPELCLDSKGQKLKDKIPIATLTLKQVKGFQCGLLKHPRFPKQKKMKVQIPTLEEVFELVKKHEMSSGHKVGFNIETKIVPGYPELFPTPEKFAQLALDMFRKYGWVNRIVLQSFDSRTLVEAKKMEPSLRLSQLIEGTHIDFVAMAENIDAEIISPEQIWLTADDVKAIHKAGLKVIPWTANEEKEWERLISFGVDGIISDYPADLIAYLKKRGLRK